MEMEAVERIEIEGENPDGFQEDISLKMNIFIKNVSFFNEITSRIQFFVS